MRALGITDKGLKREQNHIISHIHTRQHLTSISREQMMSHLHHLRMLQTEDIRLSYQQEASQQAHLRHGTKKIQTRRLR